MPRLVNGHSWIFGLFSVAALAGCAEPQAHLRQGDANSAEVEYSGDVERALPIARQHCASFEKAARLRDVGDDTVVFDCVKP